MGNIVALGGGRFDDGEVFPIVQRIVELSKKRNPLMLYLPTAGNDDISDMQPILDAFIRFGCKTDYLLLTDESLTDDEIKGAILSADIIFAGGGNLKLLMEIFKKTGADKYLIEAYNSSTVLSGSSSGAMCWFEKGFDDCGENGSFMFVDCMGLLPFCFCPHFESENWQTFKREILACPIDGIAAENGAALVYSHGEYSVIHGNDGGDVYYFGKEKPRQPVRLSADADILNK